MEFQEYLKGLLTLAVTFTVCGGATPTEFSLSLDMLPPVTDVYIGERYSFKLSVFFTTQTSYDTVIEIISSVPPSNFAIESVNKDLITKGNNLVISKTNWKDAYVLDPATDNTDLGIVYNTRGVFELDRVTNSGSSTDEADSRVEIFFDVVLKSLGGLNDGDQAYLSGGLDHLAGTRISIVSMPLTIHEAKSGATQPTFQLNPPSSIELMEHYKMTLNAELPYPSSDVKVSVTSLSDEWDDLHIQQIELKTVGPAFEYSVPIPTVITTKAYDVCPLSNNLDLNIGPLVNSVGQTTPDPSIDVEITKQVTKTSLIGSIIGVAVAVTINSNEVFVTYYNITVVGQSVTLPAPTFILEDPDNAVVSPGFPGTTKVTIETPPKSNEVYTITVRTDKNSATTKKMGIIAMNPAGYGENLPCTIHPNNIAHDISSTENNGIMDSGIFSFNISNLGFNATESTKDRLTLEVSVMMAADATEADTHDLFVKVNNEVEQKKTFTVGPQADYPAAVNFQLSLEEACSNSTYQSGTTIKVIFKVGTEQGVISGPATIEIPIPANLTGALFSYIESSVTKMGDNVKCLQLGKITANVTSWDSGSGELDRGVLNIPLICNTGQVNDVAEDEFEIEMKLRIKDKTELLNETENSSLEIGFGIKYSSSQIYTAMMAISMLLPTDFGQTKKISEIKIENQYMPGGLPPNTILQWSSDGIIFHDISLKDATVTQGTTHWTVKLRRPVVTRYVRIINTDGHCMPEVDYQETNDAFNMYGSVGKHGLLAQNFMLTLDEDNSTCMDLPLKTNSQTTPFLWVELKKSIFAMGNTSSFNVALLGEGIQCNTTTGQVTYVVYPKVVSPGPLQGDKMICKHTTQNTVGSKTQCNYNCACTGVDQCSELSLVMVKSGTGPGASDDYRLCDITVTDA